MRREGRREVISRREVEGRRIVGGVWGRCLAFEAPRERGKAVGHEPPLFPLPCHILAFLSSGSLGPQPFGLLCQSF